MSRLRYVTDLRTYCHLAVVFRDGRKVRGLYTDSRFSEEERVKLAKNHLHVYEFRREGPITHSTLERYVHRNNSGSFITPVLLKSNSKEVWEFDRKDPEYEHSNMGYLIFGKGAKLSDINGNIL